MAKRSFLRRTFHAPLFLERLERRDLLTASPTGAMLFQFRPLNGADVAALHRDAAAQQLELTATGIADLYRLSGNPTEVGFLANAFESRESLYYVEPEHEVSIALDPNDPSYTQGLLYGLNGTNGIRAPQMWNYATGRSSIIIAGIDSGIDYRHQDLYRNIWINQQEIPSAILANLTDTDTDGIITFYDLNNPVNIGAGKITDLNGNGYIDGGDLLNNASGWEDGINADGNGYLDDLVGWNFVNGTNDPLDDNGHGTHTAGTFAATGNNGVGVAGVNWRAQIIALKFLGSGGSGSTTNGALAIRYAADKGARVSNNSWGSGGGGSTMFNAIAYADTLNHVVVAAAGNSGTNNDTTPFFPASYNTGTYLGQPFTLTNLLSVAATDSNGARAGFSNFGLTSVDIGAPGVNTYSTTPNNGYGFLSGTSMASPHAAGAVGLILANDPGLTDAQVLARLMNTARPLSSLANITVTGGMVDLSTFRVSSSTPPASTGSAVDRARLTFARRVQDGSFTLEDVVSLTGPGGAITPTAVNKISDTVYEVLFPSQSSVGSYTLIVGPDILDRAGVPMDQNENGIRGETLDRYTTTFQIVGSLRVVGSTPSGIFSGPINRFTLTFNAPVLDNSFTLADVVSLSGPNGSITATAVNKISSTAYDVVFATQSAPGTYTLVVGPDILDLAGLPMDQNNNGTRGETPGDRFTSTVQVIQGLRVLSSTPSGQQTAPADRFTLTFSTPVQDGSFTLQDVVSLTGPGGAITPTAVNRLSSTAYEVVFPVQSGAGTYTLVVGPNILDEAGLAMDQNANGVPGEDPQDRFTGSFAITIPSTNRYDFGTADSPLGSGYTRVTPASTYTQQAGFGWLAGSIDARDRGQGTELTRDFNFTSDGTFVADVPNGSYTVTVVMGDAASPHDQMGVFIEGVQVDSVTTQLNQFATRTYLATISDGQLTLRFRDLGGSDSVVVVNAIDVTPGTPPLRITGSTPGGQVTTPVDRFRLTFGSAVQDGTFTLADVVSLTGPGGAITATAVNKISSTVYEVVFPSQSAGGTYTLVVGPNILDTNGQALDQNSNGTPGEDPQDRFTTSVEIVSQLARRYDFGTANSPIASGYRRVTEASTYNVTDGFGWLSGEISSRDRVTGNDLTRDFNFTHDGTYVVDVANGTYTVTVVMGDPASIHDQMGIFLEGTQVDSVTVPAGQIVTRSYAVTVNDGQLTVRFRDLGGSDGVVVVNAIDVSSGSPSFRVASSTPTGEVAGPVDRVTLTFNANVQDGSFTLNDVVSLTGPNGAITATSVNRISATVYEVRFAAQSGAGAYSLVVGPDILNESGGALDQNGNGTPAEVPGDRHTTAFTLASSARDRFDFDTADSPLATGYRRVTESTTYTTALGFGWVAGSIDSRDRGQGNDKERDFNFTRDGTFVVDLVNGTYSVTVVMGDAATFHDQMGVFLEGTQVDTVTTQAGQYTTRAYTVVVLDGQLTLRIADLGGDDSVAVINALDINLAV